jgi:RNase P/RNase MRP subunit POP5
MTLKRREKRRYISVMHQGLPTDAFSAIQKRHADLFGSIASARASLRLVKPGDAGVMIVRSSLSQITGVLVAIALADPSMATMDMSSSMKRLKRRLAKVNTAGGEI